MLKLLKEIMDKELKKTRRIMYKQIEDINKRIGIIKKDTKKKPQSWRFYNWNEKLTMDIFDG